MSQHTREMTPAQVRRHLRERMETEGALLAYETAVAICRDTRAPATAKASALKALLYVGGYDGKPASERDKPVSEMTLHETEALIARLQEQAPLDQDEGGSDLFD